MTKKEFLSELEKRLRVLNEKERQDILSEYAQHIDMRMKSGMREVEVMEDFGDVDDLVSEILEAYHLDPTYSEKPWRQKRFSKKAGGLFTESQKGISKGEKILEKSSEGLSEVGNFFVKSSKNVAKVGKAGADKAVKQGGELVSSGKKLTGKCLKLVWKFFLILLAVPAVLLDAAGVFGFGILLLLAIQGYPVIGFAIIAAGGVLAASAYILFLFTYIKGEGGRKKSGGNQGGEQDGDGSKTDKYSRANYSDADKYHEMALSGK